MCVFVTEGFEVIVYADDCSALKRYSRQCANDVMLDDLESCQRNLHSWGRVNLMIFDVGKEDMMIAATVGGYGGPVKLLGVEYDNKLLMAMHKCKRKTTFKIKSLLRPRRFYSVAYLVLLFKSLILSYLEHRTPGVHFASSSVLVELDDLQTMFLKDIGFGGGKRIHAFQPCTFECQT